MAVAISNLSATFANSSITYNAISMNVTTVAYEANSKFFTLKANGVTKFSVDLNGHTIAAGMNLVPTIQAAFNQANTGGGGGGDIAPALAQANAAYNQANTAYAQANTAYNRGNTAYEFANTIFGSSNAVNSYVQTVASAANTYAQTVGTAGNSYAQAVGTAGNSYTVAVGTAGNSYAQAVGSASNAYAVTVGAASNSYAQAVGTAGNAYTVTVGTAGNSYAQSVGTAANLFANAAITTANLAFDKANAANVLAFNTGAGANAYAVTVGAAGNSYAQEVGTAGNSYAQAVGTAGNAYTVTVGTAGNSYAQAVGTAGNAYAVLVGAASNNYANVTFIKSSNGNQTITGNLSITGSLTVSGNAFTIDTTTLNVTDPLIYLAGNNYVSDIVDIGFVGNYVNATGSNVHTGFFRDATTKEYYIFHGYDREPEPNHIDPNGNNFTISTLNAVLKTSNLTLGGANAILTIGAAFDKANAANVLAFNTGAGANAYADAVGAAGNSYAQAVGAGSNGYAVTVGAAGNSYAQAVGTAGNAYTVSVGSAGNSYAQAVGTAGNAYTVTVGTAGNAYTVAVGSAGNSYAQAVGTAANLFANAAITQANTAYDRANTALSTGQAAFAKANAALANTTGTFAGALTVTSDLSASRLLSTQSSGDEGGEIVLATAQTNNVLTTSVTIDIYQNKLRFFETGGTNRGAFINLASAAAGVSSDLLAGGSAIDTVARETANAGFTHANAAFDKANTAGTDATNAFAKANAALPNTSGVSFAGDLNITGNTTSDRIAVGTTISSTYRLIASGTMALQGGGYRVLSDGNNQNLWRDAADTTTRLTIGYNATAIQGVINVVNTAAPLVISTSNAERMRVTNTGNVLIGRTTDSTVGNNVDLDVGAAVNASSYLVNGTFLGHELLTTLSATGVATQTPTGLTLTGYRMLLFDFNGVSHDSGSNITVTINGQTFGGNRGAASLFYGLVFVSLITGRAWGVIETDGNSNSTLRNLSLTNANTSFTIGWSGAANFDAGSTRVYGVR